MADVTDEQVAQALMTCGGIIDTAAEKLGMPRSTLWSRVQRTEALQEAREEGKQKILDAAESALFKAVREGKAWATKFVLSRLGRGRGYGASLELEGNAGGTVHVYLPDDGREQPVIEGQADDGSATAAGAANDGASESS